MKKMKKIRVIVKPEFVSGFTQEFSEAHGIRAWEKDIVVISSTSLGGRGFSRNPYRPYHWPEMDFKELEEIAASKVIAGSWEHYFFRLRYWPEKYYLVFVSNTGCVAQFQMIDKDSFAVEFIWDESVYSGRLPEYIHYMVSHRAKVEYVEYSTSNLHELSQ